ncbi:type II toxin-antitoxin system RelE/ParE family toxin [Labrys wisconsinensis]|uniref:Proteic killer suppression protein n=1 Tax=Labrys wisconsinensis TaxID=425677 RepID=A0ABU0JAQ1_9HYPH|nr:type II toxin-antitoxin system RelE/ParE family toxin [Labrys wisconsinensis]MDQ0471334.1 proteic killer suppression protein [Labrys wisconsinensis]
MIVSTRGKFIEAVMAGRAPKGFPADVVSVAERKLRMLDNAEELVDLRVPPGNRLEALKGDRAGRYSIRINDQWRICFVWTPQGPSEVEIVDYH